MKTVRTYDEFEVFAKGETQYGEHAFECISGIVDTRKQRNNVIEQRVL